MLCRTLLQNEQITLFDRVFSAKHPKEHIVSPCLRLITEILSFDGGNAAKSVYFHREVTFKQLNIFLGMHNQRVESKLNGWKPSVRNNALRYLFANIRLQDQGAKAEILAQGRTWRAVFQDIREDSPSVIHEIIDTLKKYVVEDESVDHLSKARLFTDWTLGRLATLYSYHENDRNLEGHTTIGNVVHAFLLLVCTNSKFGILLPGPDLRTDMLNDQADVADTIPSPERSLKRKPIRNRTLASFLQCLRPYANVAQANLTLAVFQAAPELIADYFHKKKTFSFEPKLTATWIGYSMFLGSTIQLPIPKQYVRLEADGRLSTLAISIIMESILPQPLTQKVLTRCLNQSADLITFFAIRLLVIAFEKFEATLKILRSYHQNLQGRSGRRADEAASALTAAFCHKCPDMKHVIAVFRSRLRRNLMLREAVTRLLALYYTTVPQIALENKLDISTALYTALQERQKRPKSSDVEAMQSLELGHLLYIAHRSPDMDWWHKSGMRLCI